MKILFKKSYLNHPKKRAKISIALCFFLLLSCFMTNWVVYAKPNPKPPKPEQTTTSEETEQTPQTTESLTPPYSAQNLINDSQLTSAYTSQNLFFSDGIFSIAFDFHIFAEEVTLNAHTNGNIATNTLSANGQSFGSSTNNYLNKREDNYIGKSVNGITNIASNGYTVLGNTILANQETADGRLTIGNNSNPLDQSHSLSVYQESKDSTPYIDIQKELTSLSALSTQFSKQRTSSTVTLEKPNGENQTITVKGDAPVQYLTIRASQIADKHNKRVLHITLPENGTLILNVDMAHADKNILANLVVQLNNYTNGESVIQNDCGLLWNLYDSSSPDGLFHPKDYAKVGTSDYFFGTILAPTAKIQYGALNGSIIAKNVKQNGQESHRFDFSGCRKPKEPDTEITTETTTEITTEATTSSTSEATTEITTEATTSSTSE
ncbi:MAG: choice-of-anchor A family protein, partial [Eubacteriales bacterium]|nr:choice-of-anchor A family protein [Eubacteriales bacterium]